MHIRKPIQVLLLAAALSVAASSVTWQQAGGSFQATSTLKGIVSQGYEAPPISDGNGQIQSGFLVHPLLVNSAPFVVSALPDLEKTEGFEKVSILLDSVFSDIDGDTLKYGAIVDSGTGTVVSVQGDLLLLSGVADVSGTTRLIVIATDGSDTARDTFRVVATRTTALAVRPVGIKKSTDLSVSIPKALATLAVGTGTGRLDIGVLSDGSDGLLVNILLPGAASVSVRIFDNLGTPVISWSREVAAYDLANLDATGDGRWVLPVSWNLRSSDGQPVSSGVYLWKIEGTTPDGKKLETVKRLGVKGVK